MKSTNILNQWIRQLAQQIGRPEDAILQEGLLASDFPNSSVHIKFEDGSDLTFRCAFYLGDVGKCIVDESNCRVAVFSEHVGYFEFLIGPHDRIEVVMRKKETLTDLLELCDPNALQSDEDKSWENMAPDGRDFGSPDYDRLIEEDQHNLAVNLTSLIEKCSKSAGAVTLDGWQIDESINVQTALRELGQDVSISTAARAWMQYSQSLMAGWMSGSETVESAKKTLLGYCNGTVNEDFFNLIKDSQNDVDAGRIKPYQFGLSSACKLITCDQKILEGTPVFSGTNLLVKTFFDRLENGQTLDQIFAEYPTLPREKIAEVLATGPVNLAVKLFREQELPVGMSAQLAGLPLEAFLQALGAQGIAAVRYSADELAEEVKRFGDGRAD